MQAHNFTTKALADLEKTKEYYLSQGERETASGVSWVAENLKNSIKFMLPENGMLFEKTDFRQKDIDLFKLPYPAVLAEYVMTQAGNDKVNSSTKRIALALEHEMEGKQGVLVLPVVYIDGAGVFTPPYAGAFVPYGQEVKNASPSSVALASKAGSLRGTKGNIKGRHSIRIMPVFLAGMEEKLLKETSREELTAALLADTNDEVNAIIDLCCALNCENVTAVSGKSVKKANKKRLSSGKLPLYAYKMLAVPGGKSSWPDSMKCGTGRSPRIHLRRGHIRRLEHKAVWVQPCVVGSGGGIVVKDYIVGK